MDRGHGLDAEIMDVQTRSVQLNNASHSLLTLQLFVQNRTRACMASNGRPETGISFLIPTADILEEIF